jgi:hypothetical protein
MKTLSLALVAVLTLAASARAESPSRSGTDASSSPTVTGAQGPTGSGRRSPPTPPPEAFAACSGKAAGAPCTFQHKDRLETGTCFTPDPSQGIACKPSRPPRDQDPGTGR